LFPLFELAAAVVVFVFFLGGMIKTVIISANKTTLADCFNAIAGEDDRFLCVGSNLLLTKGDLFLFVLILVSLL
jgi:hypothetical protein